MVSCGDKCGIVRFRHALQSVIAQPARVGAFAATFFRRVHVIDHERHAKLFRQCFHKRRFFVRLRPEVVMHMRCHDFNRRFALRQRCTRQQQRT